VVVISLVIPYTIITDSAILDVALGTAHTGVVANFYITAIGRAAIPPYAKIDAIERGQWDTLYYWGRECREE
jgi:hypothetical protein